MGTGEVRLTEGRKGEGEKGMGMGESVLVGSWRHRFKMWPNVSVVVLEKTTRVNGQTLSLKQEQLVQCKAPREETSKKQQPMVNYELATTA